MKGKLNTGEPMQSIDSGAWGLCTKADAVPFANCGSSPRKVQVFEPNLQDIERPRMAHASHRRPATVDSTYAQPWREKVKVRGPSAWEPQLAGRQTSGSRATAEEGHGHNGGGRLQQDIDPRRPITFAIAAILLAACGGLIYAYCTWLLEPEGKSFSGYATEAPGYEVPSYGTEMPVTGRPRAGRLSPIGR